MANKYTGSNTGQSGLEVFDGTGTPDVFGVTKITFGDDEVFVAAHIAEKDSVPVVLEPPFPAVCVLEGLVCITPQQTPGSICVGVVLQKTNKPFEGVQTAV